MHIHIHIHTKCLAIDSEHFFSLWGRQAEKKSWNHFFALGFLLACVFFGCAIANLVVIIVIVFRLCFSQLSSSIVEVHMGNMQCKFLEMRRNVLGGGPVDSLFLVLPGQVCSPTPF